MIEQNKWPAEPPWSDEDSRRTDLVHHLLGWYEEHQRPLPWRLTRQPYYIWVSEVMAQQTRIETMLPYYHRFLSVFPTIQMLAESPLDRLLALWSGLGYYRRAENMHRTAKIIMEQHDGRLPESARALRSLPGIGDYIAGAIASIAFGKREAAVDGNVKRVVARLQGIREPFQSNSLRKMAEEWVLQVMPEGKAGSFNQALMELGALVCIPKNPQCTACPVAIHCVAHHLQMVDELPVRSERSRPAEEMKTVVLVMKDDHHVLMRKRNASLLRELWEYVFLDGHMEPEDLEKELLLMDIHVQNLVQVGTARHVFSHRIWNMISYAAYWTGGEIAGEYIFHPVDQLHMLALPAAFRSQTDWLTRKSGEGTE